MQQPPLQELKMVKLASKRDNSIPIYSHTQILENQISEESTSAGRISAGQLSEDISPHYQYLQFPVAPGEMSEVPLPLELPKKQAPKLAQS